MDLNWDSHKFHAVGTYGDRLPALRALLDEFDGGVWWGGDWDDPVDEMHFQLNWPEGDLRNNVLAAKIQSQTPPPPLSRADRYALAIITEGQRLGITPRGIQIALSVALVESNLIMYANSNDPASLDLPHDAVGSDHLSSGLFQQQPPWGPLADRMDPIRSATIFFTVDHGPGVRGLTKIRDDDGNLYDYNDPVNSPGFYAQTVQGSQFPDRYDERWDAAVDLYNRLATTSPPPPDTPPPSPEGFLMGLTDAQQQEMYQALCVRLPSKSRYGDPKDLWTSEEYGRNDDGFLYDLITEHDAALGDAAALARVQKAANAGDAIARQFLVRLAAAPTGGVLPGPGGVPVTPPVYVPPPTPSPQKITLLTFSGHMAGMTEGYPADLARAMDPTVFYWQPVGNWDPNALPLGGPCDAAYTEGLRLLREVHPTGKWSLAAYSQGAISASRLYMAMADGGDLAHRRDDFVGAVTFGNPYREQGHYEGSKIVSGHGISSTRIVGTGPHWHDYADPGDIYTNVSGPSGDDETAIYDMVMRVNPVLLMAEVLKLFQNPAPELMAMIQAIIQGISFAASNPMTAAHVSYQWRECEPGITYYQHAVNTMRAIGAQVRSGS